MMSSNVFKVHTDGSVIGSGGKSGIGPGAYAAVIEDGDGSTRVLTGTARNAGIGRMELMAVVAALESFDEPSRVDVHTDAQYIERAVNAGWLWGWILRDYRTSSGKAVANVDLWKRYVEQDTRHTVTVHHVKGHSGNEMNERAHCTAYRAAKELHDSVERVHPEREPDEPEKSLFDYHCLIRDASSGSSSPSPVEPSEASGEPSAEPAGELTGELSSEPSGAKASPKARALLEHGWTWRVRGPKDVVIWCEDEDDYQKRWVSEEVAFMRLTENLKSLEGGEDDGITEDGFVCDGDTAGDSGGNVYSLDSRRVRQGAGEGDPAGNSSSTSRI